MAFTPTVLKYDPYRKFKFLVWWDGVYVAGISKLSGLTQTIEPIDWRTGGDNNVGAKVPGMTKYEPIVLERGLSADAAFMDWVRKVSAFQAAGGTAAESFHDFRKDLRIEVFNLVNEKVMSISVFKAWPSKITVADFDASANELAIEILELSHEGWRIDERPDQTESR